MICKFCRKTIEDDSIYCRFCGRKCSESRHKRANGTGSVYKRGNSYTIRIREFANGKTVDRTKGGFKTRKEAFEYAETLRKRHDTRISFTGLWEMLQDSEKYKRLSDQKRKAWNIAYRKLTRFETVGDVRQIEYADMQEIVRKEKPYAARDIKAVLSAMFDLGQKYRYCETNPAKLLDLPQIHAKEKETFSDEELNRIWNSVDPFREYVLIMCYTGMRPIELRTMTKEDINLEGRYVTAGRKTELSKVSRIAFPDVILPLMESFEPPQGTEYDFIHRFERFMRSLGLSGKTPYCCRHTFITNLSKVTDSIAILKSAARHTDYQTTLRYTHLNNEEVSAVVNRLSSNAPKMP